MQSKKLNERLYHYSLTPPIHSGWFPDCWSWTLALVYLSSIWILESTPLLCPSYLFHSVVDQVSVFFYFYDISWKVNGICSRGWLTCRGWHGWKPSLWTVEWHIPMFSTPVALDWLTVPIRLVWFHSLCFPSRNDTEIARDFELEIDHACLFPGTRIP